MSKGVKRILEIKFYNIYGSFRRCYYNKKLIYKTYIMKIIFYNKMAEGFSLPNDFITCQSIEYFNQTHLDFLSMFLKKTMEESKEIYQNRFNEDGSMNVNYMDENPDNYSTLDITYEKNQEVLNQIEQTPPYDSFTDKNDKGDYFLLTDPIMNDYGDTICSIITRENLFNLYNFMVDKIKTIGFTNDSFEELTSCFAEEFYQMIEKQEIDES